MKRTSERRRLVTALMGLWIGGWSAGPLELKASEQEETGVAEFDRLHAMVVTQEGESLFSGLPWLIQLDAAGRRALVPGETRVGMRGGRDDVGRYLEVR